MQVCYKRYLSCRDVTHPPLLPLVALRACRQWSAYNRRAGFHTSHPFKGPNELIYDQRQSTRRQNQEPDVVIPNPKSTDRTKDVKQRFRPSHRMVNLRSATSSENALDSFDLSWTEAISFLLLQSDKDIPLEYRPSFAATRALKKVLFRPDLSETLQGLGGTSLAYLRSYWLSLHPETRKENWRSLMLHCLDQDMNHALNFLIASAMNPMPPAYQVADVLDLLARYSLHKTTPAKFSRRLLRTLTVLLGRYSEPLPITQRTVFSLTKTLTSAEILKLYELLKKHKVPLHKFTLLKFVAAFNKGDTELQHAYHCLALAATLDTQHHESLQLATAQLLRKINTKSASFDDTRRVFDKIIAAGITPSVQTCTSLITSAVEFKSYDVALQIHDFMIASHVAPNFHTYSILLKAARLSSNFMAFRKLYSEIRWGSDGSGASSDPDQVLVAELITSVDHFSAITDFNRTLINYERLCDLGPLYDLGLIPPDYNPRHAPEDQLPSPDAVTLGLTLNAYVRAQSRVQPVIRLYSRFIHHLSIRNPMIIALAANRGTWHLFLKFFSKHESTLFLWSRIIREMSMPIQDHKPINLKAVDDGEHIYLQADAGTFFPGETRTEVDLDIFASNIEKPSLFEDDNEGDEQSLLNPETNQNYVPPGPDLKTWNIILHGLAKNGQIVSAEKLIKLLRSKGITPDQSTWNGLVSGYSRIQRVDKLIPILKGIKSSDLPGELFNTCESKTHAAAADGEKHDYVVDEYTVRALEFLTPENRALLGTALRGDPSRSALTSEDDLFEPEDDANDVKGEPPDSVDDAGNEL